MKECIIKVDTERVIKVLGASSGNEKYEAALRTITKNIASNTELVSAVALSSIQYSEHTTGGSIASEKNLDLVLDRMNIRKQKMYQQCIADFEYTYAAMYTDNLIRFCFEFTRTLYESEYAACKERYVDDTKVDVIRNRLGIRKSTVCTMISDEIFVVLMLYAVAQCSDRAIIAWNDRFGTMPIREVVTHPELLTDREMQYVNMDELRWYAEKRQ